MEKEMGVTKISNVKSEKTQIWYQCKHVCKRKTQNSSDKREHDYISIRNLCITKK
jgi:hypothetical protein